jgi:hypothetical protein
VCVGLNAYPGGNGQEHFAEGVGQTGGDGCLEVEGLA